MMLLPTALTPKLGSTSGAAFQFASPACAARSVQVPVALKPTKSWAFFYGLTLSLTRFWIAIKFFARARIYSAIGQIKHAAFSGEADLRREPVTAPIGEAVKMIGSATNLLGRY